MTNFDKNIAVGNAFRAARRSSEGRRKPLDLKPTYPLDVDQIRGLRDLVVCDSPKYLIWQLLAQIGIRFKLFSRFSDSWAEVDAGLSGASVEHVVKQSNIEQNQAIRCLIDVLRDRHSSIHAETLTTFLRTKQHIELALKTNRSLAGQRADVESIVDSIMQEVCNEIFVLSNLESQLETLRRTNSGAEDVGKLETRIQKSQDRMARAHDTLMETERQTTFQRPPQFTDTDESQIPETVILDKLIDALRDENDFAKSVNERIRGELPVAE